MEYRKFGHTYLIRMDRGEEVVKCLYEFAEKENVHLASFSAIGACDKVTVGCYDVSEKQYHSKTLEGAYEITDLSGNITKKDGKVYLHLHITVADENQNAFGGHLNACTISGTCEMFANVIEGTVTRKNDDIGNTGLNIWNLEEKIC